MSITKQMSDGTRRRLRIAAALLSVIGLGGCSFHERSDWGERPAGYREERVGWRDDHRDEHHERDHEMHDHDRELH